MRAAAVPPRIGCTAALQQRAPCKEEKPWLYYGGLLLGEACNEKRREKRAERTMQVTLRLAKHSPTSWLFLSLAAFFGHPQGCGGGTRVSMYSERGQHRGPLSLAECSRIARAALLRAAAAASGSTASVGHASSMLKLVMLTKLCRADDSRPSMPRS